ncbi:cytochrome P450, family 87, subfamily A, polypeptide 6 [Hibiscus trionum]|uniref:Cytochrome P450, family 87, subfamily A, polypeptide 6 n=1 Tax=Hibiscus trionum TaxID=183268 RepID=A0A9W7IXY0_HIBTR|nr:cytochrome P450, family 87, subfamily A, polypeptide 6 [Hibiscus trionum]
MAVWLFISISIAVILKLIFNYLTQTRKPSQNLPPGPHPLPILGNLFLFRKSFNDLHGILESLHAKFGPIITLYFGSRPAIFVANRYLAHQALVQNGAVFAHRPPAFDIEERVVITTASYGSTWRVLRRNLTAEMLHSSRLKSYSHARKIVLGRLLMLLKLQSDQSADHSVQVMDQFRNSMFSLLAFMCFGDELEDQKIKEIGDVERDMMRTFGEMSMVSILPKVAMIMFYKQGKKLLRLQDEARRLIIPLILDRKKVKQEHKHNTNKQRLSMSSYVDTLLDVKLPEENRSLNVEEILGLCSEFLNGGTDNTSALLLWIMANLVKYPRIQEKLFAEMKRVIGNQEKMVKEDDLHKMPYLKAVILEGLRRHPPLRFLIPHAVTEDVVLNGYLIPRDGSVNFMIGDMGMDPKVWEDPMSFTPERFLSRDLNKDGEGFDITGSKEIKMMPFGAGRRICPGYALAILHLEYFVANLVWSFEWKPRGEYDVNMEEQHEFSVRMKHPLQALLYPRF